MHYAGGIGSRGVVYDNEDTPPPKVCNDTSQLVGSHHFDIRLMTILRGPAVKSHSPLDLNNRGLFSSDYHDLLTRLMLTLPGRSHQAILPSSTPKASLPQY
jgi:hypothetical protein